MKTFFKQYIKQVLYFGTGLLFLYFLIAIFTQSTTVNFSLRTCLHFLVLPMVSSNQYDLKLRYRLPLAILLGIVLLPLLESFRIAPIQLSYLQVGSLIFLLLIFISYKKRQQFRGFFDKGRHSK